MFFFTQGVPFFWDDHQFHEHFLSYSASYWIKDIITQTGTLSLYDHRGVYALFVNALFYLFEYSFDYYRLIKAGVFGAYICSFYFITYFMTKKESFSFLLSLLPLCSFPLYIHTLVFDEPFIIMELFKISAFLLFLRWYLEFPRRYSFLVLSVGCMFFASRTYITGYSAYATLFLFLFFQQLKRIKEHPKILTLTIIVTLILGSIAGYFFIHAAPHGISIFPFTHTFLNEWSNTISSPLITFDSLYYKSFSAMLTFFGFWILVVSSIILSIHKRHTSKESTQTYPPHLTTYIIFIFCWIISELPLWIALPEHAIRYTSGLVAPLTLLIGVLCIHTASLLQNNYQKYYCLFLLTFFFCICLTHITYSLAYRVGWGSSFIAMDSTADYLTKNAPHATVTYYGLSAAEDYLILTYELNNYTIQKDVLFVKNTDPSFYEHILVTPEKEIYVLQRITPRGTEFPPMSEIQKENLIYVNTISGLETDYFDKAYAFFFSLLHKNPLTTYVIIYRLSSQE
jgi:hypothetical protein